MGKREEAKAQLRMLVSIIRKAIRHEVLTFDEILFAAKYADDTENLISKVFK